MIFDEADGNLVTFSEPLIHTFSKTTASIGEEWKKTLNSRPNVVLMGKKFSKFQEFRRYLQKFDRLQGQSESKK